MADWKPWAMLAIALFLSSCGTGTESIDQDTRVLARVQDYEITVSWFEQTYVNYLLRTGANDTPRNRAIHLDNLIDTILLADMADEEGITSDESYKLKMARERKNILGSRYYERAFLETLPPPTDEEIRETFVSWKDQIVVRHLFYTNPEDAEAAHERLLAGRDFLDEAQECYGLSRFDSTAGYLGPIRYFGVDDAFAEAAYELEPGAFSEPVRSRFGFHIIRVENQIREALLTESEYQTRRSGLESQFRLRKRRLEGDRFVRSFMEERNVRTRSDEIEALQSLLREFARDVSPRPTVDLSSESRFAVDSLKMVMNSSTVLATYEWDGNEEEFTAGEYVFWLEKLPFQEALNRAAASVGRAMRNEILAKAGEEAGLDDAMTDARLAREGVYERARLIRMNMRQTAAPEIDDDLVRRAFDHLGTDRKQLYRADFETIPFGSYAEAERARVELADRVDAMSDWPGYRSYIDNELTELPEWMYHVSTAPIGRPVVVGTTNSWSVLQVTQRTKIEMNWETNRDEILEKVLPYATEYKALKRLRSENPIVADTLLFNQIMVLDLLPAQPTG